MNLKQTKRIALISLALLILAGAAIGYKTALPKNFAEVTPKVLYRSGQGNSFEIQNAIDRYHIRTILCLREVKSDGNNSWLETEKSVAEKNKVNFIHWPMDSHNPLPRQYWIDFLKMTKDPAKLPILVHCAQGKHRTGFFVAIYRLGIDGWSFDQVWNEMQQHDFGDGHLEIVETLKKIDPVKLRNEVKG